MLTNADNTIYHQMMLVAGMPVRVIQWPDEHNIVMAGLTRGPWARFLEGPITNFCHQIVLRDGFVHKKLPKLDDVPEQYSLHHSVTTAGNGELSAPAGFPSAVRFGITTCGYDNAHYAASVAGVAVVNLHGRMSPAQREALVRFWMENGAIDDVCEARRRADEAVHLGLDKAGQIVAVNTCYSTTLNTAAGPEQYWLYRQFVHPRYRKVSLSLALVRLTTTFLAAVFHESRGPKGIAMLLENRKLYRRSGRRVLGWFGMKLAGTDEHGAEVWTCDFDCLLCRSRRLIISCLGSINLFPVFCKNPRSVLVPVY